jgi:uncharacterized membrane protein YkvA (DUF1232 family)
MNTESMESERGNRSSIIDTGFIKKGAGMIGENDISGISEKADRLHSKLRPGGPLYRFVEDIKLLFQLLKDYLARDYRKLPYWVVGAVAFTLIYVLNPFDISPDYIPFIGQLDDAAAIGACLMLIEQELHKYRDWKKQTASGA